MGLALTFLAVLTLLELLLWLPPFWRWHKPAAIALMPGLLLAGVWLVGLQLRLWTVILAFFSLYRIVNLGRLAQDRTQADYLYHATRQTVLWLVAWQAIIMAVARVSGFYRVPLLSWLYLLAAGQILVGLVLLTSLRRHLRTTRPPQPGAYADSELPSLTVAIPARNETDELEACLESLVTSNYPKLEILVLDDCSQTKRTPAIIRDFAQDGVRFIAGQAPPQHWLAKNYAYAQLAAEASGELLLFCGVDVRFEPDSLSRLIKILLHKKKSMVSLLPRNSLPQRRDLSQWLLQPSRYAWELVLPRRWLRRPPVLSTCWLITRQALQTAGGFKAVSRKIIPESYFARQAASLEDGYSFLCSDAGLGISSRKSFGEQQATAVRTRYPQLHRRPEMVALVSLAEFTVLLWPLVTLAAALASRLWLLASLSILAYLVEALIYGKTVDLAYRKKLLLGGLLLPVAAIQDLVILNYSMWRYEFREVVWKGRNICIPVMRLAPAASPSSPSPAVNSARKP